MTPVTTPISPSNNVMSSKELAELTGKALHNIHRDIKTMFEQLGVDDSDLNHLIERDNRGYIQQYLLPRRECEILITGYDVKRRAAVIDRWHELETSQAQPMIQSPPVSTPVIDPNKTLDVVGRCINMASFLGYKENDTLLFADKMCAGLTGFSVCDALGLNTQAATLSLPFKTTLYTPTELGQRVSPPVSGQGFNKLLEAAGCQTRIDKAWEPTDRGHPYCEVLDVQKAHSDGTPVKQIKWYKSVLEVIHRLPAPSAGVTPPASEGVSPPDTPAESKTYQPEPDSVYQEPKYREGGPHTPNQKRVRNRSVGQYQLDNHFSIWELADGTPYSSSGIRKILLQQRIIKKVERYLDKSAAKYILTTKGWHYGTMYDPTTELFHNQGSKRILTSNAQPVFSLEILELLDVKACA